MLGSGRSLRKPVNSLPKVLNSRATVRHCTVVSKTEGTVSPSQDKVVIPPRVERNATDILKALASTVGTDHTAFHYKHMDDPYFYTYSLFSNKANALAKESGKKSAKWIFDNFPKFFSHQLADPPIKAFLPKSPPTNEADMTENNLISAITERNVSEAINVYEVLRKNNVGISDSAKQCLLELVCFYNCDNKLEVYEEEKWFCLKNYSSLNRGEWKMNGFAHKLFEEMDQNCPLAYSTMILGMLKHNEVNLAYEMFEAGIVKKIPMSVGVCNELLANFKHFKKFDLDLPDFLKKILKYMSSQKIKPNSRTFNAAVSMVADSSTFRGRMAFTLAVFAEFQALKIPVSLGTYGKIIDSMRKSNNCVEMVKEIIDLIEDKEHEILSPNDLVFFPNTMKIISEDLKDSDLALRLNTMLWKHNNIKFLSTGQNLSKYLNKPVDFAMEFYKKYFYKTYIPERKVLSAVIEALRTNPLPEYLPQIWNGLKKAERKTFSYILCEFIYLIKSFSDEASLRILHEAALAYLGNFDISKFQGTDIQSLSNSLIVLTKAGDDNQIRTTLDLIVKNIEKVYVEEDALKTLYEYALSKGTPDLLVNCLKIGSEECSKDLSEMAEKALPLLQGHDQVFAKSLINAEKEKTWKNPKKNE